MAKGEFSRGKRRKASGHKGTTTSVSSLLKKNIGVPPSASNKEPMEAVEGMEMMKVTAMVFCKELGGGQKSGLMGLRQCGSKLHECLKRMST